MTEETASLSYLDFKILNENWNFYNLEDQTTLKARVVLISFARIQNPKPTQPNFLLATHTVYGVESPPRIRGPSDVTTYALSDLLSALEPGKDDLKFEATRSEIWNDYVIEDSTKLSLKVTPSRIMRTKKFDLAGNPQYVVQSVVVPKVIGKDPKKLAAITGFAGTR